MTSESGNDDTTTDLICMAAGNFGNPVSVMLMTEARHMPVTLDRVHSSQIFDADTGAWKETKNVIMVIGWEGGANRGRLWRLVTPHNMYIVKFYGQDPSYRHHHHRRHTTSTTTTTQYPTTSRVIGVSTTAAAKTVEERRR